MRQGLRSWRPRGPNRRYERLRRLSGRTCSVVCADRFVAHHDADETLPATFWTTPHVAVMAAVQWPAPEGFQRNLEKCFSRRPSSFSTLGERLADVHCNDETPHQCGAAPSSPPSVRPNEGDRRCKPPAALPTLGERGADAGFRTRAAPAFTRLLTVRGRVSGAPHSTPVVPVIRDGDAWVVSPYGEVAWVRNVRRAGQVELRRGEERTLYEARELNAREATPVLRAYLTMPTHWVVRRHFKVTKRSSDDAIAAEADQHPVFALTPVS